VDNWIGRRSPWPGSTPSPTWRRSSIR